MRKSTKVCSDLLLLLLLVPFLLNSAVYMNDIEEAFLPPNNEEIGDSMIDGASYFMESYSVAMMLIYEREIAEKGNFNAANSSRNVDMSIYKLELSKNCYIKAVNLAKKIGYNPSRIDQLKNFDYDNFRLESNLDIQIMDEVKKYLLKGDVIGLYNKNVENIELILFYLYNFRDILKSGQKPDISLYWDLIRSYSRALLFGNFATSSAKQAFSEGGL